MKTLSENINNDNFSILKKFLDNNVFEIEKLSGKFVENIIFIFEDNKIFNLDIELKKNYNIFITKEYLQNSYRSKRFI